MGSKVALRLCDGDDERRPRGGAYPFTTIDPSVGEAYVRVECAALEFDRPCTPETGFRRRGARFVPVKLVEVEVELAEQMSAFRTNKDEIKRLILRLDLGFDPARWFDHRSVRPLSPLGHRRGAASRDRLP